MIWKRATPDPREAGPSPAGADGEHARLAAIMGRYCDGQTLAFHELYAALAPKLLGYLAGLAGDKATAEDLLQQTFMKVHQCRAAYVRGANPVPWLYTIAHRTCLDELRRRKRARVRVSADGELPEPPVVEAAAAMEPSSEEAALARGMAALASLPEPLKQAVLLTKIHGHSSAEAAAIAGTTAGAMKVRTHRGYQALRRKLGLGGESASQVVGAS